MLSLICPWHCSHRGTETGAACLSCHLKLETCIWASVPVAPGALLPKCECLQIDCSQIELAWKAVAQPHLPMAALAQRHRAWGCLLVLPPQTSNVTLALSAGCFRQPCSKMRMSADSSQPERASLESCCSASSAHERARTEAQRLGLPACLATSNVYLGFGAGRLRHACSQNANVCR